MSADPLFTQLENLEKRFQELEGKLADPTLFQDRSKLQGISKEHSELKSIMDKWNTVKRWRDERGAAEQLRADPDMKEEAEKEIGALDAQIAKARVELEEALLPKDPYDDKDIILEIRAGTGGDEAALFAVDLLRMYWGAGELNGL